MSIKVIAFDCFGTVFNMDGVPREELVEYGRILKAKPWEPFVPPESWLNLKPHSDSVDGINSLKSLGYKCVALSNGPRGFIQRISHRNGIYWDYIIALEEFKVYKPNKRAYFIAARELNVYPDEMLMVTANKTFGDIQNGGAVGMQTQLIREEGCPATIIALAEKLKDGTLCQS